MIRKNLSFLLLPLVFGLGACSGGGSNNASESQFLCELAAQTGCEEGERCEATSEGGSACFEPITVQGQVFNLADQAPVAGARVVAMNVNGSPISTVAETDDSGAYTIEVPATRNNDGTPSGDSFTLRADAAGFQTFPSGLRQAIPINTQQAEEEQQALLIENTLTDIGLIALEPGFGTGSIAGTVALPENSRGALVVAELSETQGFSAIADLNGSYKIFNLPVGQYTVKAYVQGQNYTPAIVDLADAQQATQDLSAANQDTASLSGSVQIVNPGAGDATSVVLIVASTFNKALIRGETPPGLRAPEPGILPNVTGEFDIAGIPAGKYFVLAAFENDFLVRDPDTCIGGTELIQKSFAADEIVDLDSGFKITGSLDVVSPGADLPETVETATPTFRWKDDSSEKSYRVKVLDSFGNPMWETTIPGVNGSEVELVYNQDKTGQALERGKYYQFRVTSINNNDCEISQTEDLKGVFLVK